MQNRGLWVLVLGLGLVLAAGCASTPSQSKNPDKERIQTGLSDDEVQELVLGFVDRYVQHVASVTNRIESRTKDPTVRLNAHGFKYATGMAAYGIAGQDNPYVALIDLLVLVSLQRMVSEDPEVQGLIGPDGAMLTASLAKFEADAWLKARRVFTDEQLDDLMALIIEWREANKDTKIVALTRFDEFAAYRRKSGSKRGASLFGLKDVSRTVDDVRLLADRAMHLVQRMPFLIGWQAEMIVYDIARQPEVQQLLTDLTETTRSVSRITDEFEKLPDMIAKERSATLDDFAEKIREERAATFDDFAQRIASERKALFEEIDKQQGGLQKTLQELRATLEDVDKLAGRAEQILDKAHMTVGLVKETVEVTDRLAARFPQDPDAKPSEAVPFESYIRALTELTNAAKELHQLVDTTDQFVGSTSWERRIEDARAGVDYAFWRGVILVGVVIGLIFGTVLLYRVASKKI